jgi:uncharacterized protein (TIGR03083 family)
MRELDWGNAVDALTVGYENLTEAVGKLDEAALQRPTRCSGWTVGDVLYHQLLDARRALRTFASPSAAEADVDDVSYWRPFSPHSGQPFALGSVEAAEHARHVRIVAAAYPPGALVWEWRETAGAACRAARACPYDRVTTQGHVLRTEDFVKTLAVEAAIHFLDLTVELPSPPPPAAEPLALVRRVLDGLLGAAVPYDWDDSTYALKGTGRVPLTDGERAALGPLAEHFPLFG